MKVTQKLWLGLLAGVAAVAVRRGVMGLCVLAIGALCWVGNASSAAAELSGRVLLGGAPVVDSTVTLWQAGDGAPQKLGETRSGTDGVFAFANSGAGENIARYVVASGGRVAGGGGDALALLALLSDKAPDDLTVNEFTTVASAFTAARFIQGESISGNPLGLRIAAMNVPNFVDLRTGSWGHTIVDGLNSWRSTTLATFDTLASLITNTATSASSDWRSRFFSAATPEGGKTPSDTLEAVAGIARQSWAHPKELFALFDEAYPQPKDGSLRAAPFAPYLAYEPPDFALMLCFWGGGLEASGSAAVRRRGQCLGRQQLDAGSAVQCRQQYPRPCRKARARRHRSLARD
jgi:hypothetical protein